MATNNGDVSPLTAMSLALASIRRWRGGARPRLLVAFGHAERLDADALERFFAARLAGCRRMIGSVALPMRSLHLMLPAMRQRSVQDSALDKRRRLLPGQSDVSRRFPQHLGHPLAFYARLRARQPVRYGAFVLAPEAIRSCPSLPSFSERRGRRRHPADEGNYSVRVLRTKRMHVTGMRCWRHQGARRERHDRRSVAQRSGASPQGG